MEKGPILLIWQTCLRKLYHLHGTATGGKAQLPWLDRSKLLFKKALDNLRVT
jgi:hypothetical protein